MGVHHRGPPVERRLSLADVDTDPFGLYVVSMVSSENTTTPTRSINDVRAPIMLLYVAAFCGGRMGEVPIWILLGAAVPVSVVISLFFERALIRELMRWSTPGALFAVGAAGVLYALFAVVLQYVAGLSLEEVLGTEGDMPLVFERLVAIKGELNAIHPVAVGLGGAIVVGAGEEVFWRGFVQTRTMLMLPHIPAALVTSGLYAGFYAVMMGPLAAIAAGVAGIVLSLLTLRTRTLVPGIICHGLLWLFALWLFPLV